MSNTNLFTIGQAAAQSGVSAKMIRHYEELGLVKTTRTAAGYRLYNPQQLQQLAFIRKARDLGFSSHRIKELMLLWQNPARPSREVKQLASQHLAEIAIKISQLQQMQQILQQLSDACCGDETPDCAILDALLQPNNTAF
ncbi:MAG TPA: Cu(I)-responsive transcriptional regulator [Rheinheimera sp.]|uniref:MerR family transcriptional regulator n=1 Tax=Rheinheimera sp. TaxID=1869214 RepID=UPI000EF019A4|nr:MerR family transcriptional regulator [Rheinheimera sp.]HCU65299.1 Cu(I)-responsive transcriptional regulator [Rheinheimera sp.]